MADCRNLRCLVKTLVQLLPPQDFGVPLPMRTQEADSDDYRPVQVSGGGVGVHARGVRHHATFSACCRGVDLIHQVHKPGKNLRAERKHSKLAESPKRTRALRERPPQTALLVASWQDSFSPQALLLEAPDSTGPANKGNPLCKSQLQRCRYQMLTRASSSMVLAPCPKDSAPLPRVSPRPLGLEREHAPPESHFGRLTAELLRRGGQRERSILEQHWPKNRATSASDPSRKKLVPSSVSLVFPMCVPRISPVLLSPQAPVLSRSQHLSALSLSPSNASNLFTSRPPCTPP